MAKIPERLEMRVTDEQRGNFESITKAIGMPTDAVAQWALTIGLEAVATNPELIAQRIRKGFGR